jgi:hypothetical protein
VPLPSDAAAWDAGAAAFRDRDLEGYADAMAAAYEVGAEVEAWWLPLARSVWSPAPAVR